MLEFIYTKEDKIEETEIGLQMAVSLLISIILWIFPFLFTLFSRYLEEYNVRQRNYTDLARTFILELVLLGAVTIKYIKKASTIDDTDLCWENKVGEQMYQLLVMFLLVLVILPFLFETVQGLLFRG